MSFGCPFALLSIFLFQNFQTLLFKLILTLSFQPFELAVAAGFFKQIELLFAYFAADKYYQNHNAEYCGDKQSVRQQSSYNLQYHAYDRAERRRTAEEYRAQSVPIRRLFIRFGAVNGQRNRTVIGKLFILRKLFVIAFYLLAYPAELIHSRCSPNVVACSSCCCKAV